MDEPNGASSTSYHLHSEHEQEPPRAPLSPTTNGSGSTGGLVSTMTSNSGSRAGADHDALAHPHQYPPYAEAVLDDIISQEGDIPLQALAPRHNNSPTNMYAMETHLPPSPRMAPTPKSKEVVVIVKSYYVSHSLRVPALLSTGKPPELETLSSTTWFDIQAQLEPLIKRHLFLPKSYLFVPFMCLMATVGWFVCFSIAAVEATTNNNTNNNANQYYNNNGDDANANGDDANANGDDANNGDDQYSSNQADDIYSTAAADAAMENAKQINTISMVFWIFLFFAMMGFLWLAFSRWVAKKNQPVDEELREVCLELSRSKTQAEGYRLEYHKANVDSQDVFPNDLFATRVLRFVPLPIPSKITVPCAPTTTTTNPHDLEDPYHPHGHRHMGRTPSSSMSISSQSSEYPTLQSLSATDFKPFPATDRILENLLSLLFVLVIFQCILSLP